MLLYPQAISFTIYGYFISFINGRNSGISLGTSISFSPSIELPRQLALFFPQQNNLLLFVNNIEELKLFAAMTLIPPFSLAKEWK